MRNSEYRENKKALDRMLANTHTAMAAIASVFKDGHTNETIFKASCDAFAKLRVVAEAIASEMNSLEQAYISSIRFFTPPPPPSSPRDDGSKSDAIDISDVTIEIGEHQDPMKILEPQTPRR